MHKRCAVCCTHSVCIYMVCVWEKHVRSKSTTHCAQIFFNHVELMSEAFIGLVSVVPSPHPLLPTTCTKRVSAQLNKIRFFHPSKWFYHWHDEYSVFSFYSDSQSVELLTQFRMLCHTHTSAWRWCTRKIRFVNGRWQNTVNRMWVYACICGAISLRRIMLNFPTYERNDNDGVDMSSTHSFGSATYNTNQFWKREKKTYFHPIPVVHLTVINRMNMRPFLGWPWMKVFSSLLECDVLLVVYC